MSTFRLPLTPLAAPTGDKLQVSLPLPPWPVRVQVPGAQAVQVVPLGEWPARSLVDPKQMWPWPEDLIAAPRAYGNPPRRALVMARFPGPVPARPVVELRPAEALAPAPPPLTIVAADPGTEIYHHRDEQTYHYVRREDSALLTVGGHRLRLRLGMEVNGQRRYWQWVNAVPVWSGPLSEAATVGGHIYAGPDEDRAMTIAEAKQVEQLSYFEEATVSAKAFVVACPDGTLSMDCHFANIQGYGRGALAHGLPLVELEYVSTHLAAPVWPQVDEGRIETGACWWRWWPLRSTSIFLGQRWGGGLVLATGAPLPQYVRDSERGLVPGAGRSCRATLTLPGSGGPPVRCLAEPAWYARCGLAGVALPASAAAPTEPLQRLAATATTVFLRNQHPDGMSRGGVLRYLDERPAGRYELSLDGNEAAYLLRGACQQTSPTLFAAGLEAARCIADIGIDHNDFNVHYHGDSPDWTLYSLIYHRFGGLVTAWQETGDPWYRELAEAVAGRWIAVNRQNQPRQNLGRDTEPVEGILMLYDATGDDHWFRAAEEIAQDVARSLFPDGTWRSGFGVGPYWGTNALRGTAWNGSHLLAGIAEWLCRATPATSPHYEPLLRSAVTLVRGLIRSIDDDFQGFHRASGSFLLRRYALVAHLAGDAALLAELERVLATMLDRFAAEGEGYFKSGHHCGGYVDGPEVWQALRAGVPWGVRVAAATR